MTQTQQTTTHSLGNEAFARTHEISREALLQNRATLERIVEAMGAEPLKTHAALQSEAKALREALMQTMQALNNLPMRPGQDGEAWQHYRAQAGTIRRALSLNSEVKWIGHCSGCDEVKALQTDTHCAACFDKMATMAADLVLSGKKV